MKRRIQKQSLQEAEHFPYPLFVKPIIPKLFGARVYTNVGDLRRECQGLAINTDILTSNAVSFAAEARTFILDGEVLDGAFYEGKGNIREAIAAAAEFARSPFLPRTLVLDIGLIQDQGWAVIEINAAWGAGLNGCRAERVWPCIAAASGPPSDKPFAR